MFEKEMEMERYRIILADDHILLRRGLKDIIEGVKDLQVVAETGDVLELLVLLQKGVPHLVIVDISMPNIGGLEAAGEIKRRYPFVKILILSKYKEREYLNHAFCAGADGYLTKEDTDTELLTAIDTIRRGGVYISPRFSRKPAGDSVEIDLHRDEQLPGELLTLRQRQVLKLICDGKSSREIAADLSISVRTAEHHRAGIMKKLKLKRVTDLIKYAIRMGYTDMGP